MAQQNINFGAYPNDPSADDVRTAFEKIQNNFTDIYTTVFSSLGVINMTPGPGLVGSGSGSVDGALSGEVLIYSNIPNISIQTDSNLQIGVGVGAKGNSATISSYATPFVISLSNSTKQNLDQLAASSASPSSAAGVSLSTQSTEEVRKQLNKLFNSF